MMGPNAKAKVAFAVLFAVIFSGCWLIVLLGSGCNSSNGGRARIYLQDGYEHFRMVIEQAFRDSEAILGMKYNQPGVNISNWRFAEGKIATKWGWKGVRHTYDGRTGILGATTDELGNVLLYLTDGVIWYVNPRQAPVSHETAHLILDSNAITRSEHHRIMKEKGYQW